MIASLRAKLPAALLVFGAVAQGQLLTPAWVELGPGGVAMARVVASRPRDCPTIDIDGAARPMSVRQPVPEGFLPACEAAIPSGTKAASVSGQTLALPQPDPLRVIAFGDTGCRIQGAKVQNCKDPAKWPFERIADAAAADRPQLVLHAGDYVYRDQACPEESQALCGGSSFGDNWETWNVDFFKPAAKLLSAAPWVLVRGNRENCDRFWRGWFYYLDPNPWTNTCAATLPPYLVQLGKFQVVAFDTASAVETSMVPELVKAFAANFAALHASGAWLLDHHPLWGMRPDPPLPGAQPVVLQQAWEDAAPQGIDMIVSGHTHISQLLSYGPGRPVQVVEGTGGTGLSDPIEGKVTGAKVRGMAVESGFIHQEHGYALFTRSGAGWDVTFKSPENAALMTCHVQARQGACKAH